MLPTGVVVLDSIFSIIRKVVSTVVPRKTLHFGRHLTGLGFFFFNFKRITESYLALVCQNGGNTWGTGVYILKVYQNYAPLLGGV